MEYIQLIVTTIIILVIFYIANYTKRKQDEEIKKKQNEIKQGDKIITYTGLSGEVSQVLEDRIILKTFPSMIEKIKKKNNKKHKKSQRAILYIKKILSINCSEGGFNEYKRIKKIINQGYRWKK